MSIAGTLAKWMEPVIRPFYGGIGCILCLHRIVPEGEGSKLGDNRALELTPESLRIALRWMMERGIQPIALDAVPEHLERPRKEKFFAVIFDDGYRDNWTHGLPVFREFGVPFTVTLTTGLLNETACPWWFLLDEILHVRDSLTVEYGGKPRHFLLRTSAEREHAFAELAGQLRARGNEHRDGLLAMIAAAAGRSSLKTRVPMLSWEEAGALAAEPLVTIGCHTCTHPVLSRLDENTARMEMMESRREISERLGISVKHLAYPFGGRNAVGPREFMLAAECGFTTATTTRCANLLPAHAAYLHALPRLSLSGNYPTARRVSALESGMVAFREFRGRRWIAE